MIGAVSCSKPGRNCSHAARLFGSTYAFLGCSNSSVQQTVLRADVAPDTIVVDVLSAGKPEHYFQYRLEPAAGSFHLIREAIFPDYQHEDMPHDFQEPAGAIEACAKPPHPQASSPSGEYLASCKGEGTQEFEVIDGRSNSELVHSNTDKAIRGFAWAPNSNSVSVLTTSGRLGLSPLELLAFVSGHPVSDDTVSLTIWDIHAGTSTEYFTEKFRARIA